MRAKNRKQYVKTWQTHVEEMSMLVMAATPSGSAIEDDTFAEWLVMKNVMFGWIESAADRQKFNGKSD